MTPPSAAAQIYALARDVERIDRDTFGPGGVEERVNVVESRIDVLGAKLAVYAGVGAAVGGSVVAAIVATFIR